MTDEEKCELLGIIQGKDKVIQELKKENAELRAGRDTAETDLATIAYMQGAERYKLKWHNLRNNPNDLPEPYTTVLDENSNKVEYIGYGKWQVYSEYYERYSEVDPPIAWCEIPKFEE